MLRFGTDGVRGDAKTDLTPALVRALGRAAARVLGTDAPFLIGRDTRESGPRIEADLRAGLVAEGAAVHSLGVLPTPGIAFASVRDGAPAAVISASHNPFRDNGVKLLAPGGRKLTDATEEAIEAVLGECTELPAPPDAVPAEGEDVSDDYIAHLVAALEGRSLAGGRVVLDCAHGAASDIGPRALRAAGADVVVLHAAPDGHNINAGCGSTHPDALRAAVVEHGAVAGLALDGDADRVLAVDERGELVDGDQIMVIAALDLHARRRLHNDAIAVTVMSNLGLRRALGDAGIGVVETAVGDRNVLVALERDQLSLGGEQSGHIIFSDLATTGDGLLTGLLLLDRVARASRPLSELAATMTRFPQVLVGVRVGRRPDLAHADGLRAEVAAVEAELGGSGRVLVRASGTEPVVRVMVEARDEAVAQAAVVRLQAAVEAAFADPQN